MSFLNYVTATLRALFAWHGSNDVTTCIIYLHIIFHVISVHNKYQYLYQWKQEQDVFVKINTDTPDDNIVKIRQNLQVRNFDPAQPQGHVMSVKYE